MAKQETKAKKVPNVGGKYGDVWTGNFKESPAVKKAQADKVRTDSILSSYKKKADSQKVTAIAKVKKKK